MMAGDPGLFEDTRAIMGMRIGPGPQWWAVAVWGATHPEDIRAEDGVFVPPGVFRRMGEKDKEGGD